MCFNLVPNLLQAKAVKASKLEWDFRIGRLENPSTTNTESSEMKHTGAISISIFLCSYAGDRCYMLLPLCKYAPKNCPCKKLLTYSYHIYSHIISHLCFPVGTLSLTSSRTPWGCSSWTSGSLWIRAWIRLRKEHLNILDSSYNKLY